ncbi:30S ribosomal protein S11 [Candidatus Kaiserbacteria bacterium RIFCSPHIGHO2_02_FULL_49_11]|uniref:Small ribosomal subunit protein uS11 n=1 Tax=Candidatus Kaiserbacteria bacterium RIFCSPHIGHO2_02_FULL_49_11 TaxID=1798489 RepID=A0A1F6D218_9BACT|nr:MAG: 30S ribosomal protein S11 [Candidatus Kaiserbacteria bacterium RIFCSPHIGHO2_02_FULL_49_11]
MNAGLATRSLARGSKKRVESGILHIQASYNNTKLLLSDKSGNALMASSSGALGFKGAKKGTPFAAAKVGEVIGEKAALLGMRDADVIMRGVGSGRESSLRSFAAKGVGITSIKDATPMPHNGPRQKKPRRV